MSQKANPAVVGGFVIGAIILIVASIMVLGTGRLFKNDIQLMAVFPGTVKGLDIDAPVLFRGVKIGAVTDIKLYHNVLTKENFVPVYFNLYQEAIELVHKGLDETEFTTEHALEFMSLMVKEGLHARLTHESLITGKQMIEFEIDPEQHTRLTDIDTKYLEIPTVESNMSKLQNIIQSLPVTELFEKLLNMINSLNDLLADKQTREILANVNRITDDTHKLVINLNEQIEPLSLSAQQSFKDAQRLLSTTEKQLNTTLQQISELTLKLDTEVDPLTKSANNALNSADKAFKSLDEMMGKDSITRHDFENTLQELAKAAKSIRVFTEYIERHPEALLKGKGY